MNTHKAQKLTALLFTAVLMTSCAFTPQTVVLEPTLNVAPSDLGKGHTVAVYVVDERVSTEIGRRGTGAMRGAAITATNDMVSVFRDAIVQNMEKLGFDAMAIQTFEESTSEPMVLRVDIRAVNYETSMGFWTGGVHVRGALKTTATDTQSLRTYEQLYRVDDEERVVVVPGADSNAQMINTAISALLQKLFDDVELIKFLKS